MNYFLWIQFENMYIELCELGTRTFKQADMSVKFSPGPASSEVVFALKIVSSGDPGSIPADANTFSCAMK